jgi:hypothetical protein
MPIFPSLTAATTMATDPRLLIAGQVTVETVMHELGRDRPVFHSEADFQHAFGQTLHDLAPELRIRLEVRQQNAEYLDLLCFGPSGRTAIEFKYATRAWIGTDGRTHESFRLRSHAATDLMRLGFVSDIARVERFCTEQPGTSGVAIMLTNESHLWREPNQNRRLTADHEFRIHEGIELAGTLKWADDKYPGNTRELRGRHSMRWRPYSELPASNGTFKWAAAYVSDYG